MGVKGSFYPGESARTYGQSYGLASIIVIGFFALIFSSITISSSLQKSPTYDEPFHLFAGYSYLRWGDFRTYPEHPPLAKLLAALPLLAMNIKDPRPLSPYWDLIPENHDSGWLVAHQFIFLENDAETLFFYAKFPMIAIGILLGVFIYLWTKELSGFSAALSALFFYGLDPNVLAHSPLTHTDIPFTAFFFIGTYFFWHALGRLSWSNLFLASFFFGLSAITKYSFFAIIPVWGAFGLLKIFSSEPLQCTISIFRKIPDRWRKMTLLVGLLLSVGLTAYFLIWASYAFRFKATAGDGPLLNFSVFQAQVGFLQTWASLAIQLQLFPEAWVYGLLYVLQFLKRPAYLLGEVSDSGFWLYFPVAFAAKTPLPTLLLLFGALGFLFFRWKERQAELFLLIPVIFYFALAVLSGLNIGLRHLLPVYPFLFVLIGGAAAKLWSGGAVKRWGLILLILWQLWSSLSVYPHYLAYFNELVGGPKNGYKILTDSSLDWGQDLKGLKRWMDENGVRTIQLGYFGTADPKYYGINAVYLPGSILFSSQPVGKSEEVPEYLAVSATYIYGVHSGKPLKEFYKPLRFRKPIATIGHSIFIYRLDTG